jgi:hypothetical protein
MKTLCIVFTKSRKRFAIGSWLIRLWTWKPYSHVALEVNLPIIDKPMYFQASEGKVNYEYKDHFDSKHEIIASYEIYVPDKIAQDMTKERLKNAGCVYGTMQNLGIVMVDIANLLGLKIENPWKKGQNCSELIYRIILKPMLPELDYNPETIKPHHIEKIIVSKLID